MGQRSGSRQKWKSRNVSRAFGGSFTQRSIGRSCRGHWAVLPTGLRTMVRLVLGSGRRESTLSWDTKERQHRRKGNQREAWGLGQLLPNLADPKKFKSWNWIKGILDYYGSQAWQKKNEEAQQPRPQIISINKLANVIFSTYASIFFYCLPFLVKRIFWAPTLIMFIYLQRWARDEIKYLSFYF